MSIITLLLSIAVAIRVYALIIIYCRRILKVLKDINPIIAMSQMDLINAQSKKISDGALYKATTSNVNSVLAMHELKNKLKLKF